MAKGKAESVDNVLELARTRQQSGMVAIEHTQGGKVEEGEVFFQAGQPIYARVGHLVGQDALNWLLKWRNIYYTMGTDEPTRTVGTTAESNVNSAASIPSPLPKYSPLNRSSSTGPVGAHIPVDRRGSPSNNSPTPGIEWLVPQKRGIEREVLSLPLTRRQRFIYFLVDGRRTVSDLSRCTGKNIQEIELILSELQEQGLVAV
ncbi:MAG TPA: DUF4388 domain-containing protein [Ktedonobacteraceae bacterium]